MLVWACLRCLCRAGQFSIGRNFGHRPVIRGLCRRPEHLPPCHRTITTVLRLKLWFMDLALWFLNRPAALGVLAAVVTVPYLTMYLLCQPTSFSAQDALIFSSVAALVIGVGTYVSVVKYGKDD